MVPDSKRFGEIVFSFAKNGFSSWLEKTKLYDYYTATWKFIAKKEVLERPAEVRFRQALEELGATFIKFGQILSTRDDLLPEKWRLEFAKLQDEVPPAPIEKTKEYIQNQLGCPLEEIFSRFDEKPFAAASIGQVYDAELKTGESVVVKVRRPGVKKQVETDLEIMDFIADQAQDYLEVAKKHNLRGIIKELSRLIRRELDYRIEEKNMVRFAENFENIPEVKIPKPYSEYTTESFLVIEKINGTKLHELDAPLERRREIARTATRAILKQVFDDGLFHADPHPGNIFILEGNHMAFIDFGMVGRLDMKDRGELGKMLSAMASRNEERLARILLKAGNVTEDVNERDLRLDLADIIDKYYGRQLGKISIGDAIKDIFTVLRDHEIHMPVELSMVLKSILTAEQIGRKLDPEFNFTEEIEPFVKNLYKKKFDPRGKALETARLAQDFSDFLEDFPSKIRGIVDKLHDGTLGIEIEDQGTEKIRNELSRASNRLSFSVIILALTVASSLMITFGESTLLKIAGIAGYLLAGGVGFVLILTTIFRKRF